MRRTLARIVAGAALAASLIGFAGVATASADDFDSGYREAKTSGETFQPGDFPSLETLYNNFNAAGAEIGHGAASGVSSAVLGAPLAAAEFANGVANETLDVASNDD